MTYACCTINIEVAIWQYSKKTTGLYTTTPSDVRKNRMQLETEQPKQHQTPQPSPGLLFVLSAPSGTGKDTVINALKQQGMDFYVVSSVTTRLPRPGESEGNPYHFISKEEFERLVANDEQIGRASCRERV